MVKQLEKTPTPDKAGDIRVGIGGWTFPAWNDTFYPPGLPARRQLEHASRQVSAIEINGTYYRTQSADSFAKWHDETPDDFVFSVKAVRFATHRKVLAEAGESIEKFLGSGLARLQKKLGPVLWQFMPSKRFDADDFGRFLALLPHSLEGRRLRHVVDVRHASFMTPEFTALARQHKVAVVFADSDEHPSFDTVTADFVYARLMRAQSDVTTGYPPAELDAWAERARAWASGQQPEGLPTLEGDKPAPARARDVFVFVINGAKERAPAAAAELLRRLA